MRQNSMGKAGLPSEGSTGSWRTRVKMALSLPGWHWCWMSAASSVGLRARGLGFLPCEPLHNLLRRPHSMLAGF